MDIYVARTGFTNASEACLAFRQETNRVLEAAKPDLVIMATANFSERLLRTKRGGRLSASESADAYHSATTHFAAMIHGLGARLAVIEDNPAQQADPIECLALHRSSDRCSAPRVDVVPPTEKFAQAQRDAVLAAGPANFLSTIPLICDDTRCHVEKGGVTVYADIGHLSAEFTLSSAPTVKDLIIQAVK